MNKEDLKNKIEDTTQGMQERLDESKEDVEDMAGETIDMINQKGGEVGSKLHQWRKDTDQAIDDAQQTTQDEAMEDEAD